MRGSGARVRRVRLAFCTSDLAGGAGQRGKRNNVARTNTGKVGAGAPSPPRPHPALPKTKIIGFFFSLSSASARCLSRQEEEETKSTLSTSPPPPPAVTCLPPCVRVRNNRARPACRERSHRREPSVLSRSLRGFLFWLGGVDSFSFSLTLSPEGRQRRARREPRGAGARGRSARRRRRQPQPCTAPAHNDASFFHLEEEKGGEGASTLHSTMIGGRIKCGALFC